MHSDKAKDEKAKKDPKDQDQKAGKKRPDDYSVGADTGGGSMPWGDDGGG